MARTRATILLIACMLGTSFLAACSASSELTSSGTLSIVKPSVQGSSGPLHTQGSKIVNAVGQEVRLTGVNWFGMETGSFAPDGLWARNWMDMLKQIAQAGFNTIRLPYSNQFLDDPASMPTNINYQLNPDLKGLHGLSLLDKIIDGAHQLGLKIILDQHRPDSTGQSALWYTDHLPESQWISDWVMLARHYKGNDTVIGADLHNEPHGPATWGDGNPQTDWRLAAERAGNAILAVNPDWLIFVEGVEQFQNDWYWWGGNLEGAEKFPVQLSMPNKLVYEAHDYGPSVSQQSWFSATNFPQNLAAVWVKHWAYLQQSQNTPVLVGEFGGPSVGQDVGGIWQRTLVAFLKANNMSYTYWCWNPNSGDTGGILENDWTTINQAKLDLLKTYQWPLLDKPQA